MSTRCLEQRWRDGALELTTAEREVAPGDGEVCVALEAAAVSASELELARRGSAHAVLGGALVGEVIATTDTSTEWAGRRVIVPSLQPCGECNFCRRGAPHGCATGAVLGRDRPGALSERVVAMGRWLSPADGDLEVPGPTAAALGGDGLISYTAFCRAGVSPGEPALVLGGGARSLLATEIARSKGAKVVAIGEPGVPEALAAQLEALPSQPWRVFALDDHGTGIERWARALAAIPPGSTLVVGELASGAPLPAVDIIAASWGHPDLLPELVALAARRELDLHGACVECAPGDDLAAQITRASRESRVAIVSAI